MSQRFYVMPFEIIDGSWGARHHPFWNDASQGSGTVRTTMIRYGDEEWGLVRVRPEPTGIDHTTVTADPQVFALPVNLQNNIAGNRALVESRLEAVNIPGTWVTANMSWRTFLLHLIKYLKFLKWLRVERQFNATRKIFHSGRTLDTTWSQLSVQAQTQLRNTADRFNLDYSSVTGSTTIRDMLILVVQQWNFDASRFVDEVE